MKFFIFVALFAFFAAANAGIISPLVSAYSTPLLSSPVVAAGVVGEQTIVAGPSGTITRSSALPALAGPIVSSYGAPLLW